MKLFDKRGRDPPNTPLANKKYVFIDEILKWLETNSDKTVFEVAFFSL